MIIRIVAVVFNLVNVVVLQQYSSQCKCVLKPGTNECLQYDNLYQAENLEDAMQNFQDLTLDDDEDNDGEADSDLEFFGSSQKESCQAILIDRLAKVGLFSNDSNFNRIFNATSDLTCNKYSFGKPSDKGVYEYGQSHEDNEDDKGTIDFTESSEDTTESYTTEEPDDNNEKDDEHKDDHENYHPEPEPNYRPSNQVQISNVHAEDHGNQIYIQGGGPSSQIQNYGGSNQYGRKKRRRRQAMANNITTIGTRYGLTCTSKGIDDGTGYMKLCSSCWAWRKLPDNYFPQFVNELICDDKDGKCLSGYAVCGLGTRTIEVIKNDTGKMSVINLMAGSYCECKVQMGSTLAALAMGSSNTKTLPSLPPIVTQTTKKGNLPLFGR